MILALKILGGVAALLIGIWLGMPGRYRSADEIEDLMEAGGARRKKVRKRFVAVAWLQRQISPHSGRRSRGFGVERPEDR